jgi:hypothetical protein
VRGAALLILVGRVVLRCTITKENAMKVRLALGTLATLVPLSVSAASLPVSYLVEEKPLKVAIAGTPLTFSLYSDDTCTTLVESVQINVEDVTVLVKLKQMTPKNDTKLSNTVELRHTLAGVAPSATNFLRVSGDGVVAVGDPCQAQGSSFAGSPPVTAPAIPVLTDSSGAVVGTLQMDDCGPTVITKTPAGKAAAVAFAAAGFLANCHSSIYFSVTQ